MLTYFSRSITPATYLLPTSVRTLTINRLQQQQLATQTLLPFTVNNLWDNPGARKQAKRLGRGPGSGLGKTSGRGHKGRFARAGGTVNRGFEGGQSGLHKRFPKFGFSKDRFNNGHNFSQLNLGKLAYHIEKGHLDTSRTIQMKDLLEAGVVSKVGDGVKLLGKGQSKFAALGKSVSLEIADASEQAIEAVKGNGGSLSVQYRTPLLMRNHLKPHKFNDQRELKTPMPHNKAIKKMERLERKGLEVSYPSAPWFTDNKEAIMEERAEKQRRIREGEHHELLPKFPMPRTRGMSADKPRVGREDLPFNFKFQ